MSTPKRDPPITHSLSFENTPPGPPESTMAELQDQLRRLTLQVTSQAETIERLQQGSSGASAPSPDCGHTTLSAVEQLAETIASTLRGGRREISREQELSTRAKTLADLLRNAPKFTGDSDVWLWKKRIMEYLHRRGVDEEHTRVDILLEACEGAASEYLGSIEWPILTVDSFWEVMEVRFQRDEFARMADYEVLRQRPGQTYRKYADVLLEKSYGLSLPKTALLRKFLLTMQRSTELRRFFIPHLHQYQDVRELAAAVEQMTSEEEPKLTDKKGKCRVCGKTGHFAISCPLKRRQTAAPPAARVVQPVASAEESSELLPDEIYEEDSAEQAEYDEECLEDYEEVGNLQVWPAEKRPADSSARHQEALKRLRGVGRPRRDGEGPSRTLPPPPARTFEPTPAPARAVQLPTPTRTTQPERLAPVPLRGYRAPVPRPARPAMMPVRGLPRQEGNKSLKRVLQGNVDVPAAMLAGLALRASERPQELAASWMAMAEDEAKRLLVSPTAASTEVRELGITEIAEMEPELEPVVNPLNTGDVHRRYVGYMPVKLGTSDEIWWALIDTGAQVSVISAGLANYLDLYGERMCNVFPAGFQVSGYNDTSSYLPVLQTRLRLGARGGNERWMNVHLCVLDTNKYKLIIGVDLLNKCSFIYEGPQRKLHLTCNGSQFSLPIATRDYAFRAAAIKRYHKALEQVQSSSQVVESSQLVEIAMTDSVEATIAEAETARYENTLSWTSREYIKDDPQLISILYTAEITGTPPSDAESEVEVVAELEGTDANATNSMSSAKIQELTELASNASIIPVQWENVSVSSLQQLPTAEEVSSLQFPPTPTVESVLPQQSSAGDMGMAALPQQIAAGLSNTELQDFLAQYHLAPTEGKAPLSVRAAKLKAAIEENPELVDASRTPLQRQELFQMLLRVADVFATSLDDLQTPADTESFQIDTGDSAPIKQRPFRMGTREVEFLNITILGQTGASIVVPSQSPWRSPAFVAYARHYGDTRAPKMRKVIDYRKVNRVTRADTYPLPDIPDLLEWFSGFRYLGAIDLKSGYWQTRTSDQDACKTAFVVPGSLHEYRRVPFGLKNAPAFFQRAITTLLQKNDISHSRGFVDDLLTGGDTWEAYLAHQRHLFETLRDHHWLVTPQKVRLGYEEISVLGHRVGQGYVKPDLEKISAISRISPPTNVGGIRAFVGLVGYYRRFIPHFARIAKPLTSLTGKDVPFEWGQEQQTAFTELKTALTELTLLHTPTREGRFRVYTDYCSDAIAAALHQEQGGQERPIAFVSRLCRGAERSLSSAEGELCALVYALGKFRNYLGYEEFDIITDSHALLSLKTNQNLSSKLTRWAVLLSEFNFNLIHKPGSAHRNADGLSRCPQEDEIGADSHLHVWSLTQLPGYLVDDCASCSGPGTHTEDYQPAILEVNHLWNAEHRLCAACGQQAQGRMLTCGRCGGSQHAQCVQGRPPPCYWYCGPCTEAIEAAGGPADLTEDVMGLQGLLGGQRPEHYTPEQWDQLRAHYVVRRGQLLYETEDGYRVYPTSASRAALIEQYHGDLMHSGWRATAEALRERYYWPGMESDVRQYCRSCLSCQLEQAVFRRTDTLGGHLTAAAPRIAWSIDCAPAISTSAGRQSILLIVDDFTRFVVTVLLPSLTSGAVKQAFIERILTVYGKPQRVRTDQGREFAGAFTALLAELGIEHIHTRPISPWTNGRAERMVRQVKSLIRRSMFAAPITEWTDMLPWVTAAINSTVSRTTGYSPHEVFFGEAPRALIPSSVGPPVSFHLGEESQETVDAYVRRIRHQVQHVHARAREIQKQYEQGVDMDYQSYPVAGRHYSGDGSVARKKPHCEYQRGSLVMVKRMRGALGPHNHHFALKAAGPFIVVEQKKDSLLVQGPTGQRKWQNKANCLPLQGPLV